MGVKLFGFQSLVFLEKIYAIFDAARCESLKRFSRNDYQA